MGMSKASQIILVEKNPNVFSALLDRVEEDWEGENIRLVYGDIRKLQFDVDFDLIVSELLGSFGDNELAPECLLPASRFLKKGGVMIPQSITSYLQPVECPKSYAIYGGMKITSEETCRPYIIHTYSALPLAAPQSLFQYDFDSPDMEQTLCRRGKLEFVAQRSASLHGFMGYFRAVLAHNVALGIHPDDHSPGMQSWFPIYFPTIMREVGKDQRITVEFCRDFDKESVWYQWRIGQQDEWYNAGGRYYKIYKVAD